MVKYFAYNGNTNTYCPVSEPGNDSGDNKNHPSEDSFRKPLRRIGLERQIPSIFDNSPNTVYEAMAYGKIVVASKVGGIPEIINSVDNGLLFDPQNINSVDLKIPEDLKLIN